jgi:hypothetical protein
MNNTFIKNTIKRLEKEKEKLAKNRDSLRAFRYEMEELEDCCKGAIEDLELAIDRLSELV